MPWQELLVSSLALVLLAVAGMSSMRRGVSFAWSAAWFQCFLVAAVSTRAVEAGDLHLPGR